LEVKYDQRIVLKWFESHGLSPVPEFRFEAKRKWRFDFAFPESMVALEVEGGVFTGGRHTRGSGFIKDIEKYNHAAVLGWRVLRTTPSELCMGETVQMIKNAIEKTIASAS
jgi:very-short-patch-repair endonuclease